MPTLEEYAHLLGIPISDKVPFSGLEEIPRSHIRAEALHLKKSEIEAHWVKKGGMFGLTSEFLIGKATVFAQAGSVDAFKAIFVLLIYSLALFPNIDSVVDANAIRLILIGNHVPTLLGEMYFSLHLRTCKGGGTIVYHVPLLYKWFISHLPHTPAFLENKQCLRWSQRLMFITNDDIIWYDYALSSVDIIDSCGEFSNVPLIALEAYTTWVKKRTLELKMSYACERPMSLVVAEPLTLSNQDVEELEDALTKIKQETDIWEERFHALSQKHEELQLESKKKDTLIELLEDRAVKRQREPEGLPSSSMPRPSSARKKIVDQLVLEKAQMKTSFDAEIRRIRRKYAPTAKSSDTVARGSLG
ncbi:hypothetical protein KIW84_022519 [Lathyrus oleraceus]|uniref:DUF7745 domain-containing protein n=1 Tax=Pisum sativum TaxID=3888 RepID=A0A9D5B6R3_PEA|nr:hypothetical protein KIW84_022519 [Pisum sativum]